MTLQQAARLDRYIRKLAERDGHMLQQSRPWSIPPLYPPVAIIRRQWWRATWHYSESALMAEGATFGSSIYWDEPARPVRLHYAEAS